MSSTSQPDPASHRCMRPLAMIGRGRRLACCSAVLTGFVPQGLSKALASPACGLVGGSYLLHTHIDRLKDGWAGRQAGGCMDILRIRTEPSSCLASLLRLPFRPETWWLA
ncbi:unnamed protein product [Protopolystoma xenopodis]|uniref:Uncharacterized protein n=1 Tax=Protopolystoma xenopodis TaxID=117903 RepID=A0A3S5C8U3_9PLAT|nr:unnamed protein product [Protopolystoma xenopodis]